MSRSQVPALLGAFALGAGVVLLYLLGRERDPASPETAAPAAEAPADTRATDPGTGPPESPEIKESVADNPQSPLEALENAGLGARTRDPARLLADIGEALETGDFEDLGALIGSGALTAETRARLAAMAAAGPPRLRPSGTAREVGELELNRRARWALHLEDAAPGRDRIFFDLVKDPDGNWRIESLTLPPEAGDEVPRAQHIDPLGIADAFIQATLRQEFRLAREFVDPETVSDPKIAGLCILFEEGEYRMRPVKPLRAITGGGGGDDHAGFLAHVVAADGSEEAKFSIRLERDEGDLPWRVVELNLEQLLADYARRVAGGDVYYTPLIHNPAGGDTLVLYFDFDEAELGPRTRRQLGIVADVLSLDSEKKLTISGHTDALGTEDYNEVLSARRAASVMEFLVESGVDESQIITVAEGQTQPRRPNFTPSGEDDPSGRRANRRSEIYLDF